MSVFIQFYLYFFCKISCIFIFFEYNTAVIKWELTKYKAPVRQRLSNSNRLQVNIIALILFLSDIQQAIIKKVWQPTTLKNEKQDCIKTADALGIFNSLIFNCKGSIFTTWHIFSGSTNLNLAISSYVKNHTHQAVKYGLFA